LRKNPFGEQGQDSPALKMVYMAAYNLDTFRRFVFNSSFLSRFEVEQVRLEKVRADDTELLLLGFDWILRFLGNQGPLKERANAPEDKNQRSEVRGPNQNESRKHEIPKTRNVQK
jgi:hypothetical protein